MKQLQVEVPDGSRDTVEEIIAEYTNDYSSTETEKDGDVNAEFTATVSSEDIDEITGELKDIKEIDSGELMIRILQQESLIEKGQETKGYSSSLSQEEIYSKAQQFSSFTRAQWGLIAISAAIASYGLILDNLILVIGAMMLAPLLSPFVSAAVSLAVGDRSLMFDSLKAGSLSALVVLGISVVAVTPLPVTVTSAMEMVVSPGLPALFLSMLVGAAAALTFTTGLRDQIAGVAVAIALVPPLAGTGIALRMTEQFLAVQAAVVALTNIIAVIVAGFLTFKFMGLSPGTYYKQKEAERIRFVVPAAFVVMILLMLPVTFLSYQNLESYTLQKTVESEAQDFFDDDLMDLRFEDSMIYVTVLGEYDEQEFISRLPEEVEITVREIPESG